MSAGPFRLAVLISGRGSNMIAIARACLAGSIPARVAVVISDRADAAGLAGAAALGIATATVLQSKVAVQPGDSEATLSARVQATEHIIYPRVLGWCAQRRLAWREGAAWLDGRRLDAPMVEDFRAAGHH